MCSGTTNCLKDARAASVSGNDSTSARTVTVRPFTMDDLKNSIRHVPDFPKAGILFYDITTLLQKPEGVRAAITHLSEPFVGQGVDVVVGVESRGFIFGAAVADR